MPLSLSYLFAAATLWPAFFFCSTGWGQITAASSAPWRGEIVVEQAREDQWRKVDPGLMFAQDDRLRFRFRSNFSGFLYVMNHDSSGKYTLLFPGKQGAGSDNRIDGGKFYTVPAEGAFRITGPPGHEVVYWLVSPVELKGDSGTAPGFPPLPRAPKSRRSGALLIPRCDDALFRSRGDCVDLSPRDLVVDREKDSPASSSPPLRAPVVYEFHLAHK